MTPDEYLDKKENLLTMLEVEITAAVLPQLQQVLAAMAGMDDTTSDEEREAALTPLNDRLAQAIGESLFFHQREMTDLALEFHPGTPTPMLSPDEWLKEIKMSGTSLAEWFRRRSPSRWMKDVMRATPEELRHTVSTAIDHALWTAAHRQERFSWDRSSAYKWITRPELARSGRSCDVCTPLNGQVEKRISDFPIKLPAHPHCHCGIVPVTV